LIQALSDANLDFKNILVLDFGQLGDVIMSLPALNAIREKFPTAKITVMGGKAVAEIVKLSGFSDELIIVDRVKLRDSARIWSIKQIFKIIGNVRSQKFDFVIDIHSLPETNLLGFISGAKKRLYANRESRSLDSLGNFRPNPPEEDKSKHLTDRYLDILKSLEIENPKRFVQISPQQKEIEEVRQIFQILGISEEKPLVGLFLGAGHPSRRWKLDNFVELANELVKDKTLQSLVFLGPEEADLVDEVKTKFPKETIIIDKLSLLQFFAALSFLQVLISNDTGPMHLGAIAGASIVLVLDKNAPTTYLPLTEKLEIVSGKGINEISVEEVFQATKRILENET
jgi:ADP-heptose:LPS heptosyltransferase